MKCFHCKTEIPQNSEVLPSPIDAQGALKGCVFCSPKCLDAAAIRWWHRRMFEERKTAQHEKYLHSDLI